MFSRGHLSSSLEEVHVASDDVLQRQLVIVTGGSTLASDDVLQRQLVIVTGGSTLASDDVLQRQLVIVTGGSTLASGLLVTRDSATTSRNATTATQTSSLSFSLWRDGEMRVPTVESPQLLKSSLVEPQLVSTQPSRASAYCEEFCLSTIILCTSRSHSPAFVPIPLPTPGHIRHEQHLTPRFVIDDMSLATCHWRLVINDLSMKTCH